MGYMTEDFARLQTRKFTVYYKDKREVQDEQERARQLHEHQVRQANANKKKTKKA